jgi:hypothetical protein
MKIIKIKWRDSSIYNAQGDNDYPFEVSIFESVGFLLKETKTVLLLREILLE